jgi:hypothetical protein
MIWAYESEHMTEDDVVKNQEEVTLYNGPDYNSIKITDSIDEIIDGINWDDEEEIKEELPLFNEVFFN